MWTGQSGAVVTVHCPGQNVSRAVSVLGDRHDDIVRGLVPVGKNQVNWRGVKIYWWDIEVMGHESVQISGYAMSLAYIMRHE